MRIGYVMASLAAAAGGLLAAAGCQRQAKGAAEYVPVTLVRERFEHAVESTGVVEPRNRLEIKPPIGGRIEDVLVQEGQAVRRGEIIAWMSSTDRAALLDAARAQGEDALRQWQDVYRPTPLIAPLDGTIIARKSEPGQTVTGADVVLVLSDRLIIKAQVDETDIGKIVKGMHTSIRLDAYPDVVVTGMVDHIAYEAETVNNVTIYEVHVGPAVIPACMKSGMTVSARFVLDVLEDVLVLPSDVITEEPGGRFVLVDDGRADTPPERRAVEVGLEQDGRTVIRGGLTGDERIVREPFSLPESKEAGSPLVPTRRRRP